MFKTLAVFFSVIMFLVGSVEARQDKAPQDKTVQEKTPQDKAQPDIPPAKPQVGDRAPDWTLLGTDGQTYQLSNFKGKQGVVVAWYPAALTGG